ncbi:MAG: hypothetical protein NTW87_01545 [Planctomycetota bacterium]|nr:hypothetical protein [Planctomycetota bacterium]
MRTRYAVMLFAGYIGLTGLFAAEQPWTVLVTPDNSYNCFILKDGQPVLKAEMMAWGTGWGWAGSPASTAKATAGELKLAGQVVLNKDKAVLKVGLLARKSGEQTLTYRYELSAENDTDLTMLITGLSLAGAYSGQTVLTFADGKDKTLPLPTQRGASTEPVGKIDFQIKDLGNVTVGIEPPCNLHPEGGTLRVMLAHDKFAAGTRAVTLTLTFPGNVAFAASQEEADRYVKSLVGADWFAFQPANDMSPGVIGMNDWLEKPAGKHGMLKIVGDHFELADGTRIKFWGTNLSYGGACCPKKAEADNTAARFAKYGVNGVRLHKFCGPGWEGIGDPNDGTKLTSDGLDRLDYFSSKLTENGVYYGFSHTFGYLIRPGNRDRMLAYDEIAKNLQGKTYALMNYAEDLQDLRIEMVVNLLKHKNPYTGRTYAEDPALSYIELQNEDDIFFYTTDGVLKNCPTYQKDLMRRFAEWLKAKYGSQEALDKAWTGALKKEETLEAKNIEIQGNPWFMGEDGLAQVKAKPAARLRLMDNAAFLHDVQNKFYSRFVKAIRDAGYNGPLCGSPWQAPAMVPHYYNLRSDYLVGWIDRHNYFGEGIFDTMLSKPGSGTLGSGLQQVADRPFGVSEWIHVYPDLYSAEGPALFAAYGMGLQGWDASYEFQSASTRGGFAKIVGNFPWGVWDADVPTQIGQFPALSRMVLRGDVKEGEIVSTRRVSLEELQQGQFSFSDLIAQAGDIKEFGGTCPAKALAAGRCVVEFVEKPAPSTFPEMAKFEKDNVIVSSTRQLSWDCSGKGFFTVDTEGTKAVVGFAEGKELSLGSVKVGLQCPYASVFVTAIEKNASLATARAALITAVARNCNAGLKYFTPDNHVLDNGKDPIMLEPVKARFAFAGREIAAVNVLDHDGRRTTQTLEVKDGSFVIDGAKDKALYYEVLFK